MEGYRDTTGCFWGFWIIVGAIALTVACCLLFPGCASSKYSEMLHQRDSAVYHHIYDTTKVNVIGTVRIGVNQNKTTEEGTQIAFGAGGGTYNSHTGEATNVASVNESRTIHEQKDSIANLRAELNALHVYSDSLAQSVADYKSELAKEREVPKRSGYDRFCSRWFWITAILLLLKLACWTMEKVPATAPYIFVIRKFIPFL